MIEKTPNISSIPAGAPFASLLCEHILQKTNGAPETMKDIRILLPSRRACRTIRDTFLKISAGKPLILPILEPLGDTDEDELTISMAAMDNINNNIDHIITIPPAIPPLKRQILLARLIENIPDFRQDSAHALNLARALARFMDQVHTENLSLNDLHKIVPDNFADHWQITLRFLEILSKAWPEILKERGMIDGADRRNRLILMRVAYWEAHPPQTPIIAAGSTGSIPAVAELLRTIASLPKGHVILPGYDEHMDEESWDTLKETHPQYGFKNLLASMNVPRNQIKPWPDKTPQKHNESTIIQNRRRLLSEMMRPAETTSNWTNLDKSPETKSAFKNALENLDHIECDNEHHEASTIALIMRETLETTGKTLTLITPDRALARRVSTICNRWKIKIDDSAGQTLDQTDLGSFLRLIMNAVEKKFSPVSLLAVLRHKLCHLEMPRDNKEQLNTLLDMLILRGPKPKGGFEGIVQRIEEKRTHENKRERITDKQAEKLAQYIKTIEMKFQPLLSEQAKEKQKFDKILRAHLQTAENLTTSYRNIKESINYNTLWHGETGESASAFFTNLLEHSHDIPDLSIITYGYMLQTFMHDVIIRPKFGTHPRLSILGQIEARLVEADHIILAGLNEGTWPADSGHDPWMSKPMRQAFGLPAYERSTGLSAHDFAQGFAHKRVTLTRSKKTGGTFAVPSRWLQRFDTVLLASGIASPSEKQNKYKDIPKLISQTNATTPCTRPAPCPPIAKRPQSLSVTRIETWLKDPYSIYARYVLKLEKLRPIEQDIDAALRGTLVHKIFDRFTREFMNHIPDDAKNRLQIIAQEEINALNFPPEEWSFWWPRFDRMSNWLIEHEKNWRKSATPVKTEALGRYVLNLQNARPFTLTARADRIDKMNEGYAIIDYKTGGQYGIKAMEAGEMPQLPLEAIIASEGGFENLSADHAHYLGYWVIKGGADAGSTTEIFGPLDDLLNKTQQGLEHLILAFENPDTPYHAIPNPENAPRFNDYEHLSRLKEWGAQNDTEEYA